MKRTDTGRPVISFCLIVRNAAKTLETTLKSIRERCPQAEIVIVDTMSSDESPEIAKRYADVWEEWAGPSGDWTREMRWFSDAAAARQRTFALASGRWLAWIDSDDRLPGAEEAEQLLKLNKRWCPPMPGAQKTHEDTKPVTLEEVLLQIEEKAPATEIIYCPYLYAKDQHGSALIWQDRERILKASQLKNWRWAEAAHEILVPQQGHRVSGRVDLPHLLFVHEREFTDANTRYSIERHFDVLSKQYEAGDRTTRRSLYLAAYAQVLCPTREGEFVESAHQCATTPLDRYRCMLHLGQMYVRQGLFMDALEAYGAATHLKPELPDAWIQGAEAWMRAEDWPRAATWLEKGVSLPVTTESYINPRFQEIRYPVLLAMTYEKLGQHAIKCGQHAEASQYLKRATEILDGVRKSPSIGQDGLEAETRFARMRNAWFAQANAIALATLAQYLIDNDETKKALEIVQLAPWNLQDHPLVVELEKKLAPVALHLSDNKAYQKFYQTDKETGAVQSPDEWLEPEKCMPRVRWVADWINKNLATATVLDMGCFDGIMGIALLRLCPHIKYVGVDIHQHNLDIFQKRLEKFGLQDRAKLEHLTMGELLPEKYSNHFDVILWCEVIEHVPSPYVDLCKLATYLKKSGSMFVTTPWGAFDAGLLPEKTCHGTPRSLQGHVRAMTPRDVVKEVEKTWTLEVEEIACEMSEMHLGDAMHIRLSQRRRNHDERIAFVVPGALWDWNATTVKTQGMGASEKSIVQMAEALSDAGYSVEVYGPVPYAEVNNGVRYWPLVQLRHANVTKIIISRSPGFAPVADNMIGKNVRKILWLQDAFYPDLNAEVAEKYEKIVVVSQWHAEAMHQLHGVPLDKMEVIYNPVDPALYRTGTARKNDHFIYCSSPDRALIPLLRMWPKILEKLPNATLDIFYGWRGCEKLGMGTNADWTKRYQEARREFETLRYQKGVTVRDMVSPNELARTFCYAGVWLYPVPEFTETCCTAALEARAAGCIPVAPPLAALAETAQVNGEALLPLYVAGSQWQADAIETVLWAVQQSEGMREIMSKDTLEQYSIKAMLEHWKKLV